jgi:hypothetical protein
MSFGLVASESNVQEHFQRDLKIIALVLPKLIFLFLDHVLQTIRFCSQLTVAFDSERRCSGQGGGSIIYCGIKTAAGVCLDVGRFGLAGFRTHAGGNAGEGCG